MRFLFECGQLYVYDVSFVLYLHVLRKFQYCICHTSNVDIIILAQITLHVLV